MNRLSPDTVMVVPDLRNVSRAKSCTRCRQAKVACDARRRPHEACSRCKSKSLDCRFNAHFKRVATRKLTEEITHGMHARQTTEQTSLPEPMTLKPARTTDLSGELPATRNESLSVEPVSVGTSLEKQSSLWPNITDGDRAQSYTLGKLKLEAETVVGLFQHFGVHYHPYSIFIQPCPSLSDLLSRSPLLFWTLILVASQDHAQFAAVYQGVIAEHEGLLSPILQRSIQQVETIHALLLLCLWPIPQARHFHNPAWNYIGLAINAAMQLNCHSPLGPASMTEGWHGLGHIAVNDLSTIDQSRTWLGCFWVGNVIAAFYGLPPPMSTQQQIRSVDMAIIAMSNSIPSWWDLLFSILKITNSVMDILGCIEDHALHFSLTQMFDDQLNKLKKANSDIWISSIEIEWCNAKLYLYALTFTIPANAHPSHKVQIQVHRQAILYKALESASDLITELKKLGQLCRSDMYPDGLLSFVPKPYFTALFNATTFLFRFMATYVSRTSSQENHAMGLIIEAHKVFQSFPKHRESTRAAIHIETLMEILRDGASVNLDELVVNNKLGASIMFDAVFQACRQRNIDPRTGTAVTTQKWKTVNETFAQRLPDAPARKTINRIENDSDIVEYGMDSFDLEPQSFTAVSRAQNPQWWETWDSHIDLFQVGVEQWGPPNMEQSADNYDNLDELGGFMYT